MADADENNFTGHQRPGPTRRGLFSGAARWGGLAALAAVAGWLGWRGAGGPGDRGEQIAGPLGDGALPRCAQCAVFLRCTLPEAETARAQGHGLAGAVRGPVGQDVAARRLCE